MAFAIVLGLSSTCTDCVYESYFSSNVRLIVFEKFLKINQEIDGSFDQKSIRVKYTTVLTAICVMSAFRSSHLIMLYDWYILVASYAISHPINTAYLFINTRIYPWFEIEQRKISWKFHFVQNVQYPELTISQIQCYKWLAELRASQDFWLSNYPSMLTPKETDRHSYDTWQICQGSNNPRGC